MILCMVHLQAMEGISVEIQNETGSKLQITRSESDKEGTSVENGKSYKLLLQASEGPTAWIISTLGKHMLESYDRGSFEMFDSQNNRVKSMELNADTYEDPLNLILAFKKDKIALHHRKHE